MTGQAKFLSGLKCMTPSQIFSGVLSDHAYNCRPTSSHVPCSGPQRISGQSHWPIVTTALVVTSLHGDVLRTFVVSSQAALFKVHLL